MYLYAGCDRGTGAIPCRRASAQVIIPFPLSSYRASASSPPAGADAAPAPGEEGTEQTTGSRAMRKRHRGIDPIAERRRAATMPTFAEALDSCIALRAGGWKAGSRNEANWRSSLAHAAPLANRAVDAIASDDVVGIVTALLRAGKAPTARSVRQRIRLVFEWCIAQGHRTDNPANDAIDALLPSSGHKTKHRESVAVADVAQVVAKIETTAHASRLGAGMALRFLVLTAARTSEAIGARWSEIDLDHATWIIPAARMKGGEAHRVPLAESRRSFGPPCLLRGQGIARAGGASPEGQQTRILQGLARANSPQGFGPRTNEGHR